jgi:hypothetical protein
MPGFFHQWQQYCGLPGMIVCEQVAPKVPAGWSFFRAGHDTSYKKWTGNLKLALEQVHNQVVLLVLDDYWLTKPADTKRIERMAKSMIEDMSIDKIDLTNDRMGFAHADWNDDYVRSLPHAEYLTSTQAALWNITFLRQCLSVPSWSPWEFELIGTKYAQRRPHKILGCRVPAIHYANVMLKGNGNQSEINKLSSEDLQSLDKFKAFK